MKNGYLFNHLLALLFVLVVASNSFLSLKVVAQESAESKRTKQVSRIANGEIVDSKVIRIPPRFLKRLTKIWPECETQMPKIELSAITYMSDGLKVKGFMARPKDAKKALPCVIYNRGGNRNFGALKAGQAAAILGPIAADGYVVVASQYRGNGGSEGKEEFGGKDINDVMNLILLLEKEKFADSKRIGMIGWSRGGMMTYLALKKTDKIKGAVVGAGVTDLFAMAKSRPEMETGVMAELIPDFATEREKQMKERSVKYWPEKLCKTTPILILHGGSDWRVPPSQVFDLVPQLHKTQQPFRFVMFEGGDHGIREHRSEVHKMTIDWLNKYVRDSEKWPSLKPHGR